LFFETNASSFLSGDFTNGTSLGSVSPTVQRYDWMLQTKCLRTALNSISLSLSPSFPNLKVWNGSLLPSNAVSDADVRAWASFTWSKSSDLDPVAGSTSTNSAPFAVLFLYQNRLPSFIHCGFT
jgi:hypothetical protein